MVTGISCRGCGVYKPMMFYHKGQTTCTQCRSERNHDPDVKYKNRNTKLKKKYGIDNDQYNEMRKKQYGCYICKKRTPGKYLHVDHCHKTGEIRKLLCSACNTGLGLFKDNPDLLLKASDYIKEHEKCKNTVKK